MTKDKKVKENKEILKISRDLTIAASERAASHVAQVHSVKNVKAEIEEGRAVIDVFVIVNFGCKIPDVAYNVQNAVKTTVESAAEVKVDKVNIHVEGVKIIKDGRNE